MVRDGLVRNPVAPRASLPGVPRIRGAAFDPAAFEQEVVSTSFLGRRLMILSRPDAVQHLLVTNAANYVRPNAATRVLGPPIGGGLFLAEGAEWRRQRRMLAPAFAPRASPSFARHVASLGADLVADLAAQAPADVALFDAVQRLALAVAAWSLFSIDMAPYDAEMRALSSDYAARLAQLGMLDFLLPVGIPSPRDLRRRRFRRRWMALIHRIVADRRRHTPVAPAAGADLFDTLTETEVARGLFDQQVATLLITGSETTSAALFWSLLLLAGSPEWQDRIAAEAATLDLSPDGAAASLPRLHAARAVVQEAMRLYPPAFSIVRQALAADRAGGTDIPAGAIVQAAPWVLHRHRLLWDRPDAFDPARFLPDAPPPPRFTYLPFGVGPRACIAAPFAQLEAVLVVALLVRAFVIAPTTDRAVTPVAQITLQPWDPPPLRITLRHPATPWM